MAKNRMINTKFWSDGWIVNLDPLERYLYLYFLTNEHTNICGIYELPLRIMARESGIDDDMLNRMIKKMSDKISYFNGWIYIKNFIKHQKTSGNVKLGIENGLKEIPKEIMSKFNKELDTPLCVIDTPRHSPILELESEFELESKSEPEISTIVETANAEQVDNRNKDINWLIDEFQNIMSFKSSGTKDRFMAKHLLNNFSKEQLTAMLTYCSTNEYAPRIGSVEKLWYKRGDIIAGIKSLQSSKKIIQSL